VSRGAYVAAAALVILAGLALRLVPWDLPLWAHHVGGGVLWGAMLFLLAAGLRPRSGDRAALATAFLAATAIEFVHLYRAPGLDAFRATLAGQLLLAASSRPGTSSPTRSA
jgi:hypothetical protein